MSGIWCICGHDYDDHIEMRDAKTHELEETWCAGIDSKNRNEIQGDEQTKKMSLNITCQCRKFIQLQK